MPYLIPVLLYHFVTPLVAKNFDSLPNILHEPLVVSTPVGESANFRIDLLPDTNPISIPPYRIDPA